MANERISVYKKLFVQFKKVQNFNGVANFRRASKVEELFLSWSKRFPKDSSDAIWFFFLGGRDGHLKFLRHAEQIGLLGRQTDSEFVREDNRVNNKEEKREEERLRVNERKKG